MLSPTSFGEGSGGRQEDTKKMKSALDIIEHARSYYLLSNDKQSKPLHIGGRIKLQYALENVSPEMVIATTGNKNRCVVLLDFTTEEIMVLKVRGENKVLRLKAAN